MTTRADVLVVDDEHVVRGAVRRVCREEGLQVEEAETVEAGAGRIAAGRYRVALVDLMLPATGGMRLLEAARVRLPEMPVVMITGYATAQRKVECLIRGAFDVLPKPFDANELLAVLRRALAYAAAPWHGEVPQGAFALGNHAWARLDAEGTASLGLGPGFRPILTQLSRLETVEVDAELEQGRRMATIVAADGLEHRVWSPLSGRVVLARRGLERGRGVLRIVPTDLQAELERLTEMQRT